MKVKLLRKVRKRFEIYYNPHGIIYSGTRFNSKYFVRDNKNTYSNDISSTEQGCKEWILKKVRIEYRKFSKKFKSNVKIWYNK